MENITSANHIEKSVSDITYTFLGPSICLLSSVICIIGLFTYLKKLHKFCKRLLLILSIHNFICSVITLGILVYMTSSGNQNLGICSLLVQVVGPPTYITSENISLLSYIRHIENIEFKERILFTQVSIPPTNLRGLFLAGFF